MTNQYKDDYNKPEAEKQLEKTDLTIRTLTDKIRTLQSKQQAYVLIKLLPYLPKEVQSPHKLKKILGVSHQTIYDWINNWGHLALGGENK